MHSRDQLASIGPCVLKGKPDDAFGCRAGDDADGLGGHVGYDVVLDARIEPLGVLAHDHEIDVLVARGHSRHGARRTQVSV